MIPASLSHSVCTVKVLALEYSAPCVNVVLDVIMCLPFLEKLYVTVSTPLCLLQLSKQMFDSHLI
jgi:hypothetical protein